MIQCAYCGRTNLDSAGHCLECGTPLSVAAVPDAATTPPEKPPELPALKVINPEVLAGAFSFENGFHRAKWELVGQWIDSHVVAADALAAWHEAFLLWTTKLRDDLGGN